jgi:hypothetical protein
MNSHYLSPALKQTFVRVVEKVAKAFASTTEKELAIIENFKKEIDPLHGDPIYYENA